MVVDIAFTGGERAGVPGDCAECLQLHSKIMTGTDFVSWSRGVTVIFEPPQANDIVVVRIHNT